MSYATVREIHNDIKENIRVIEGLFHNAQKMQDSIASVQRDEDRQLMTENFNNVVSSINSLVKCTENLFDKLESLMEE